jgi:hypothetical protein
MYPLSPVSGALPEEVAAQLSVSWATPGGQVLLVFAIQEQRSTMPFISLALESYPPGRSNARPQGT